jgi:predicted RNase H-like HicB family nuclease
MNLNTYTAAIKQTPEGWIGWIEELPGVNCQEPSRSELLQSLKITLGEAIQFNRHDALEALGSDYQEESIFA